MRRLRKWFSSCAEGRKKKEGVFSFYRRRWQLLCSPFHFLFVCGPAFGRGPGRDSLERQILVMCGIEPWLRSDVSSATSSSTISRHFRLYTVRRRRFRWRSTVMACTRIGVGTASFNSCNSQLALFVEYYCGAKLCLATWDITWLYR